MENKEVLLIDGSNLAYKCLAMYDFENPKLDRRSVLYGIIRSLRMITERTGCYRSVFVWDYGKSRFRSQIWSDYKVSRNKKKKDKKELFNIFFEQLKIARLGLKLLGIRQISFSGLEADDILAYIVSNTMDMDFCIVSTDKDLHQCISDNVCVFDHNKKVLIDKDRFYKKNGFFPDKFIYKKILTGDIGDNIPGVNGIGDKTASKIIKDIDNLSIKSILEYGYKHSSDKRLRKIIGSKEILDRNIKMMRLPADIECFNNEEKTFFKKVLYIFATKEILNNRRCLKAKFIKDVDKLGLLPDFNSNKNKFLRMMNVKFNGGLR